MKIQDIVNLLFETERNITKAGLISKFPGIDIDGDLDDLEQDVTTYGWGAYNMRLVIEPANKFTELAEHIWQAIIFPKERTVEHMQRILRIIRILKGGAPQRPIYLDGEGYILEGRHRTVAFYLLDLPTIPVVYVTRGQDRSPEAGRRTRQTAIRR